MLGCDASGPSTAPSINHGVCLRAEARDGAAALDAAQGRDQGGGVMRQADRLGVGDELARRRNQQARDAGHGEGDPRGDAGGAEHEQQGRHEDQDQGLFPSDAAEHVLALHEHKNLHQHVGGSHEPDVAVLDVRDLVRDDGGELVVVEGLLEAAGRDDDGGRCAQAAREGVERRGLDAPDLWQRQPGCDGGRLDDVDEARVRPPIDVREGDGRPHGGDVAQEAVQEEPEAEDEDDRGVALDVAEREERQVLQIEEDERHEEGHGRHYLEGDGEAREHRERAQVVAPDVAVEAVDAQHARTPSAQAAAAGREPRLRNGWRRARRAAPARCRDRSACGG